MKNRREAKIVLAVVLVLVLVVGLVLYNLAPAMKLGSMMKEAYGTADSEFTLMLNRGEDELHVEGCRLSTVNQTEARFFSDGGHELTRVVVDGQTAYVDFWPLLDALGDTFFELIERETPAWEVPDYLRQNGIVAMKLNECSQARSDARTAMLTILKDSLLPELRKAAQVDRMEDGAVLVHWKSEELAALLEQAGARLTEQVQELYVQMTALIKAWGTELNQQDSLVVRMNGKILLGVARQRENDQAQGVAELGSHLTEQGTARAEQVRAYGGPQLRVWKAEQTICQELSWTTQEGNNSLRLDIRPSTKTSVEVPGQESSTQQENQT